MPWIARALAVIYRHECAACQSLELTQGCTFCDLCNDTLIAKTPSLFHASPKSSKQCESRFAAFEYGGQLSHALCRLKYGRKAEVARALAPTLLPSFQLAMQGCDLAIAVPLHPRRMRARGFNQSDKLLRHLSRRAPIRVQSRHLRRVRDTPPQAALSRQARLRNMAGSFVATTALAGRHVLLFDDVCTTGATLDAATKALFLAGAKSVTCYVAALSM